MAQLHLSDEILMAFADGELDEPVAATVEEAMASDPAIAKRVAEFLRSRRIVRSAFPEESAPDVPSELRAAVLAQIDRFEGQARPEVPPKVRPMRGPPSTARRTLAMALAASVAALAIGTAGYLVGRQDLPSFLQAAGPIPRLADPEIGRVLSESRSGQEEALSFGRMRVISTFRTANGSLCREFKLQAPSGTSDAVACRNGGWTITFALASAADSSYVPSGGGDLMAAFLQEAGAGEPLQEEAEIRALREAQR